MRLISCFAALIFMLVACTESQKEKSPAATPTPTPVIDPIETAPTNLNTQPTTVTPVTISGFGFVQPTIGVIPTKVILTLKDNSGAAVNCTSAGSSYAVGASVKCENTLTIDLTNILLSYYDAANTLVASYSGTITLEAAASKTYEINLTHVGVPLLQAVYSSLAVRFFQDSGTGTSTTGTNTTTSNSTCVTTAGVTYQQGGSYQELAPNNGGGYTSYTRYCCSGAWSATSCPTTSCYANGYTYNHGTVVNGTRTDPAGVRTTTPFYCCTGTWSLTACQ